MSFLWSLLINRLPSSLPFELLHHKALDYTLLRVLGYLCFATNTYPHKDKFAPRAIICVFLGLSPGLKAYKLYDVSSKHIFVSQDIIFHEHIFPFQSLPSPSMSLSLPALSMDDTNHSIPTSPPPTPPSPIITSSIPPSSPS